MQREREKPRGTRALDNRPVHVADVIRHDVIEISHRLMQVQAKHEPHGRLQEGVGCAVWRKTSAAVPALGSLLRASPSFSMKPASRRAASDPASEMACAA